MPTKQKPYNKKLTPAQIDRIKKAEAGMNDVEGKPEKRKKKKRKTKTK